MDQRGMLISDVNFWKVRLISARKNSGFLVSSNSKAKMMSRWTDSESHTFRFYQSYEGHSPFIFSYHRCVCVCICVCVCVYLCSLMSPVVELYLALLLTAVVPLKKKEKKYVFEKEKKLNQLSYNLGSQWFVLTDAKHYVFCVSGTKNAYSITQNISM